MNKFFSAAVSVMAVVAFAGAANADNSALTNVTASVSPTISIVKTQDMSFGSFAVDSTNTTPSEITTAGVNNTVGGNTTLIASSGAQDAAFTVAGDTAQTYDITLPTTLPTLFGADVALAVGPGGLNDRALTGGTDTFTVRGTFSVPSDATGSDSSTFTVSVNY